MVVGGGPAGLAAAAAARRLGVGVLLVDESPRLGGRLWAQPSQASSPRRVWDGPRAAGTLIREAESAGVEALVSTEVWSIKGNVAPAAEGGQRHPTHPWQVLTRQAGQGVRCVEAKAVLVATGAKQEPVVFPGWTLPGVLTAGGVLKMIHEHRIVPGRSCVVVGVDAVALAAVVALRQSRAQVQAVVLPPAGVLNGPLAEPRRAIVELVRLSQAAPFWWMRVAGRVARLIPAGGLTRAFPLSGLRFLGAAFRPKVHLVEAQASAGPAPGGEVARVIVAGTRARSSGRASVERVLDVDFLCASGGLSPLTELTQAIGCCHVWVQELGGLVPLHGPDGSTTEPGLFVAGSVAGVEAAPVAIAQGRVAGLGMARHLGAVVGPEAKGLLQAAVREVDQARRSASLEFFAGTRPAATRLQELWKQTTRPPATGVSPSRGAQA